MPRKQKKYHYIYKTTNIITGKYYYGMHSTHNLDDGYLGSGKRLRYSINKYGKDVHSKEILEFLDSREELKKREAEIVNLNEIAKEDCMNIQPGGGGGGGWSSKQQSNNGKKGNAKMKILRETNPDWVKKRSENLSKGNKLAYEEGRREIKHFYDWTGKRHSEETKNKIGKANSKHQKGSGNSQYGTMWIHNNKLKKSKRIKKEDNIPNGWEVGRRLKF